MLRSAAIIVCVALAISGHGVVEVLAFETHHGAVAADELQAQIRSRLRNERTLGGDDYTTLACEGSPRLGLRTHPWLTEQTIKASRLTLDSSVKAELILGSIFEDVDLKGGALDVVGGVNQEVELYTNVRGVECIPDALSHLARAWVLGNFPHNRSENHFDDLTGGLPRGLVSISEHAVAARSWATDSAINQHTWKNAVRQAREERTSGLGWRSFGHILHLLQDLGVPAHVRNDPHIFRSEVYEAFFHDIPYDAHGEVGATDGSGIDGAGVNATSLGFREPRAFFRHLALRTQRTFYSRDTIFADVSFGDPLLRNTDIDAAAGGFRHRERNRFYVVDRAGRKLARYIAQFFLDKPLNANRIGVTRFPETVAEAERLGRPLCADGASRAGCPTYLTVADRRIVEGYWQEMAREIIAVGAEFLRVFHELATTDVDRDEDGLPDGWEVAYFGDLTTVNDPNADFDGDGLSNIEEFRRGTDPTKVDTDGDGFTDKAEVDAGTDPLDPNSRPLAGGPWRIISW